MVELFPFDRFPEFRQAADRARHLAMLHKTQTGVQRAVGGWEVLVPHVVSQRSHREEDTSADAEEDFADESGDERESLMAEIEEDREDWARSGEEGWFYGDG